MSEDSARLPARPAPTPPSPDRFDYLEVVVAAPQGTPAELAAEALFAAGASGIEEGSVLADDRIRLTAYIPAEALPLDALPLARAGAAVVETRRQKKRDWEAEWRASLAPILLGERLAIVPTALEEVPAGRTAIRLDPGMGFGSGSHPTTALSAALLEAALAARAGRATAVLDVGTGSGILAIAAWLLGARPVHAIDVDPLAVDEATANAARNGCADGFRADGTPLAAIAERFPLVVANLDAPTLEVVHDDLAARLEKGGALIISGLRERESWPVPAGLALEETVTRDGWRAERWRAPS